MQKTNFKTRLLALLTAVFMVVMCMPFAAFAEGPSKADTTRIHVAFQGYPTADNDVYNGGTVTEITAPGDDSIDYWQVDGGKLTVKPGQAVSFEQLLTEIGTPLEEGTEKVGYVSFKAVEKAEVKSAKVNYYDESAKKQIAEIEMETYKSGNDVMVAATTVFEKCPAGYEVVNSNYIVRDGYVYVAVKPVPTTKTIKINYYSEEENKQISEVKMEVAADATYVNSGSLKAPDGYELVESGDFTIRDGYVYAAVRKVKAPATTKTIKINYYSEAEEKQIAEVKMEVAADATYVNSGSLKAPEGYELVLSGDLAIRDGYVYAAVKKIGSKVVKINYYSEAEEKQIKEEELTVAPDATCVNTSKLTAPTGYELVEVGDLPIRDGYVYAAVRKVPTTTIKISYVDEATDKEVGTEDLVVNQGTTVVNFNVLKSVPAGYELCEVGDFYVGNGSAKVMVRKTKSNNGSSSSNASSSSNTTNTSASNTTNTSASQKQVVKAAAAPANTTKVLPKTGATNAAPLIGGSLAVVALLMGYGVYGLVLRKKD